METFVIKVSWNDKTQTREEIECNRGGLPYIIDDFFRERVAKVRPVLVSILDEKGAFVVGADALTHVVLTDRRDTYKSTR